MGLGSGELLDIGNFAVTRQSLTGESDDPPETTRTSQLYRIEEFKVDT